MGRILFLLLCAAAIGMVATNRVSLASLDPRSVGTTIEGRRVLRTADQVEARFTRLGAIDDTYMLFGGDARQRKNQITHAHLAGLRIGHARSIAVRHPDFHLCKSPGAAEAMRLVQPMDFVAADRASRATVVRALDLFEDRLRSGGERTCLHVRGAELALESVRIPEMNEDMTDEMRPAFAQSRFVLVEHASVEDCQPLLR